MVVHDTQERGYYKYYAIATHIRKALEYNTLPEPVPALTTTSFIKQMSAIAADCHSFKQIMNLVSAILHACAIKAVHCGVVLTHVAGSYLGSAMAVEVCCGDVL